MKRTAILKKYFFENPITEGVPPTPITEVAKQLKELTAEDKAELVEGAAKELGVEVEE